MLFCENKLKKHNIPSCLCSTVVGECKVVGSSAGGLSCSTAI